MVIARAPFKTIESELSLAAPDQAMAGSKIAVNWTAPRQAGKAEIRIYSDQGAKTIFRRPIELTPAAATLEAPDTVKAGEAFDVRWTGPAGDGDYITLVKPSAAEGEYEGYFSAVDPGQASSLNAHETAGDYELRYVTSESKTITRRPVKVE